MTNSGVFTLIPPPFGGGEEAQCSYANKWASVSSRVLWDPRYKENRALSTQNSSHPMVMQTLPGVAS